DRNVRFAQPGRYDAAKLRCDVEAAGLVAADSFAFFLKPFPHDVMNGIEFSEDALRGLFRLGIEFPELACQLYIEARPPDRCALPQHRRPSGQSASGWSRPRSGRDPRTCCLR